MLFDIGSVEKNFQAALCLTLVEEGIISLDDLLEKWFPPYPNIDGKITIRQLLNMTSGIDKLVDDPNSPFRIGYRNIDFSKMYTWDEIYKDHIAEPNFEPGTKCEYSTPNYIILKHIIERAAQSKQTALLESRLLKPNNLNHTLTDFSKPIPDSLQIAHGWLDIGGDGTPDDISGNSLNWIASLSPMLVYSTPGDMAAWTHALFHAKTVLRPETLDEMLAFFGPVQNEHMMKGYGLGVVDIDLGALLPRWENVRFYGHLGSQFGYSTIVGYFPEFGVSMAMMFNKGCDGDTERAISTVGSAVFDVLLGHLGAEESKRRDSLSGMIKELKKNPDDVHLMYSIATKQRGDQEDYEASLMYEEILKHDPEDVYGYKLESTYWKAIYDGVIHKKPENLIAFISEHKDYKDIKFAYEMLAKTYLRRDETDKAVQVYRDALQVFGKDADYYNQYAWWVYENKVKDEYETAIQYTNEALAMDPGAYHIWDTLAWLYFENGEQEKAVDASSKALGLAPEDQHAYYEESLKKIQKGK